MREGSNPVFYAGIPMRSPTSTGTIGLMASERTVNSNSEANSASELPCWGLYSSIELTLALMLEAGLATALATA